MAQPNHSLPEAFLAELEDPSERSRLGTAVEVLTYWQSLIEGDVLDFGASWGTSMVAVAPYADRVIGVEPELERVEKGRELLSRLPPSPPMQLLHIEDTTSLPFADESFDLVYVNAVFEHIPQPRDAHIRETWRLVRPGGHMLVTGTPNKYLPKDVHTTGLWWVPWLPSRIAERYARWRDAFAENGDAWQASGWRGLGYGELVAPLERYEPIFLRTRPRHRVLDALGLPPLLLDPYLEIALRKV